MKQKSQSLQDLAHIKQSLKKQRAQQHKQQQQQAASDAQSLFSQAVGAVRPLRGDHAKRIIQRPQPVPPHARQRQLDESVVLKEAMSDAFDAGTLLETDEDLSYRRAEIGTDVIRKLRKGYWSIQRQIDLHGLRRDAARESLGEFLRTCLRHEVRCVRIITGKGLGSPNKQAVLKHQVPHWLAQRNEVLAFVQARPADGGAGAIVALLRKASTTPHAK